MSNQSKRRVAILVKIVPNKLGSFEDWIVALAVELARDCTVTVVTYSPCHSEFSERLRSAGVRWAELSRIESSIQASRHWIKSNADVCHFSLFAPRDSLVLAAQSVLSTKVIFQDCFSTPVNSEKVGRISEFLDRVTFARTRHVVGVSEFVSKRLARRFGISSPKLSTIYNGVDSERFLSRSAPSDSSRVVCVAALIPEKGVQYLIQAMATSRLQYTSLCIVGDGPMRVELERLAAKLQIASRIEFLGLRSDVQEIVGNCAAVVHPAVWGEAFGLTIVEAMLSGRAIVASNVGAIPELLAEGCGVLVPPGDHTSLAEAIGDLLDNPSRRDEYGRRARVKATKDFSLVNWCHEHAILIRSV
ncbi:MAG: glycosyltransferase family 4 protein [Gemmatimonadaceae bacterium]|nr:glycosyltransferase family 4 protein [Gemmatimonadaceae bacterium]